MPSLPKVHCEKLKKSCWLHVFTLHGLQDCALHMRTTMLSSALSNSPLSCAGECTCTPQHLVKAISLGID